VALLLLVAAASAGAAKQQVVSANPSVFRVNGRVVRPTQGQMLPVAGQMVTLHRVGPDSAGPLDSVRAGSDGRFSFHYRRTGSDEAVYFASASYEGIAYFSQPLRRAVETGEAAEITVFDTTSHPVPIHVRGRHLVVSAPSASTVRSVVEVFELSNDSSVTMIAPPGGGRRPVWQSVLPSGVEDFHGEQGDVPADAIAARGGRAQVYAPFAPGLKQLSFGYALGPSAFPLRLPMESLTSVMEVLLEEPGARVEAPGMREVNPVSVSGRTFRRYLAQDLPASGVVRVMIPPAAPNIRPLFIAAVLTVLGAAMLGTLAYAFLRH